MRLLPLSYDRRTIEIPNSMREPITTKIKSVRREYCDKLAVLVVPDDINVWEYIVSNNRNQ